MKKIIKIAQNINNGRWILIWKTPNKNKYFNYFDSLEDLKDFCKKRYIEEDYINNKNLY